MKILKQVPKKDRPRVLTLTEIAKIMKPYWDKKYGK
jgi:hypothetical protein